MRESADKLMRRHQRAATLMAGLALGALALACDKVPLMAPTGTTITLFASATIVPVNGSVEITANVIESAGTPVQNGTQVTFVTTLGTLQPAEAQTHDGQATVRLLAGGQSGVAEVRATSGGVTVTSGDALKISIGGAAAGSVQLTANPTGLPMSGGTTELLAIVFDTSGNRLPGATVLFSTDTGTLSQSSTLTNASGEATVTLSTSTTAKVTATVPGGSGSAAPTASVTIALRAGPAVTFGATVPSPAVEDQPVSIAVTITVATGSASVRSAVLDFGDGATQALSPTGTTNATHTFRSAGTYQLTATVSDTAGETTVATTSLIVKPQAPIDVTLAVSPTSGLSVGEVGTFTATVVLPSGSSVDRYVWDFGDGSGRTTTGKSTTHIYSAGGRFVANVHVYTTDGAEGFAELDLIVGGIALAVSADNLTPLAGVDVVTFTASVSSGVTVQYFQWTFGDGANTTTITGDATHVYATAGNRTVTVRAVLADGTTVTGSIQISVR